MSSAKVAALLMASLLMAVLSGCGGGGGGEDAAASGQQAVTPAAVAITSQPTDQQVQAGVTAKFTITATNATSYRWQSSRDGSQWADTGTVVSSLEVPTHDLSLDGMQYRAVVSGEGADAVSASAKLSVLPAPVQITLQPTSQSVVDGMQAIFTVNASGTDLAFEWEVSTDRGAHWSAIANASSSSLVLPQVTVAQDGAQYRATVANALGKVTTHAATLTVTASPSAPDLNVQPTDATVLVGQTARFSATVYPYGVSQWQISSDGGASWSDIPGARSATLVLPSVSLADNGKQYRLVIDMTTLQAWTRAATLHVLSSTNRKLTLLAGHLGDAGFADGQGADARFNFPEWTATDAAGNVYVSMQCSIRKITPSGWVSTVAGSAGCGYYNGVGSAAVLSPGGIVVAPSGDLYVADFGTDSIRKVSPDGTVTTLAGTGGYNAGSADGTGAAASFNHPAGIAIDRSGNLYVADSGNNTIRKVTSTGKVSTYAGRAGVSGSADGPASQALFNQPWGVAVDGSGIVYVADSGNAVIRAISTDGVVSTVAGVAGTKGSTDGVPGVGLFEDPVSIASNAIGVLYVTDSGSQTIRRVDINGSVTTIAGKVGVTGTADGPGPLAAFNGPSGISFDASRASFYVADARNQSIRKIAGDYSVSTYAGINRQYVEQDGTGAGASFAAPTGLAKDAQGNLYVGDRGPSVVRKVTSAGTTTSYSVGYEGPAVGQGTNALAVDASGTMYVADGFAHVVRRISADGTQTVLAGQPGATGGADGQGSAARFVWPNGIALDPQGNLYVSDDATIRKVTPSGKVTTYAGTFGEPSFADGPLSQSRFGGTGGLVFDTAGNLYVAQYGCVRKISTAGIVSTLAGDCQQTGSIDATGSAARFGAALNGIDIDSAGNVYVADTENATIREITPSGVVRTVLGTSGSSSVVTDDTPLLNNPHGVIVIDAAHIAVTSEGAVLIYTLP
jgi:sugar lactone lactonase YvrE